MPWIKGAVPPCSVVEAMSSERRRLGRRKEACNELPWLSKDVGWELHAENPRLCETQRVETKRSSVAFRGQIVGVIAYPPLSLFDYMTHLPQPRNVFVLGDASCGVSPHALLSMSRVGEVRKLLIVLRLLSLGRHRRRLDRDFSDCRGSKEAPKPATSPCLARSHRGVGRWLALTGPAHWRSSPPGS